MRHTTDPVSSISSMHPFLEAPETSLEALRARVFRYLLLVAIAALAIVATRGFLISGLRPWPDLTAGLLALAGYFFVRARPARHVTVSWCLLLFLCADVLDGILPWHPLPVTNAHMLAPLLVLYGATLGNLRMTIFSSLFVFALYTATGLHYAPLTGRDVLMLSNLCISALAAGMTGIAVWRYHEILLKEVRLKALDLRMKLVENRRLQAVIFHDIANPLQILRSTLDLMKEGGAPPNALERMEEPIHRIQSIIGYVHLMSHAGTRHITLSQFPLRETLNQLQTAFQERLDQKQMQLDVLAPDHLQVLSHPDILLNSVLANLLSNAIKFSPPKSRLRLSTEEAGNLVRIRMFNPGHPIPEEVLSGLQTGDAYESRTGTQGEQGLGYGLRIVQATLSHLGGNFQIKNEPGGVSVELEVPSPTQNLQPRLA